MTRQPPTIRQQQMRQAIQRDEVLTGAQLQRRGLDGTGFPSLPLTVRPHSQSRPEVTVTFYAEPTRLRKPTTLAHSAALAEVRYHLTNTLPPEQAGHWAIDYGGAMSRPDAVWNEETAIEVDTGYAALVVRRKMKAFEAFPGGIIWATTSPRRSARLQALYPEARVMTVDYWTPGSSRPQTSSKG